MNDARNRDDVAKFMLPQAKDRRASSHRGRSPGLPLIGRPRPQKARQWSRYTILGSYGPRSWPLHATHGLARVLRRVEGRDGQSARRVKVHL